MSQGPSIRDCINIIESYNRAVTEEPGDWDHGYNYEANENDFEPATNMCPDCEGSGQSHMSQDSAFPGLTGDCERCNGEGEIFEELEDETESSSEELLYPPTVYDGEGNEHPYEIYHNTMDSYSVGDIVTSEAAAPGYGKISHRITRMDDTGVYGVLTSNTIRELEPWMVEDTEDNEPECSYCDDEEPLDGVPCLNCGSLQYVDEDKYEETSCSQCGKSLGPGDSGVSHCKDHMKPEDYAAMQADRYGNAEIDEEGESWDPKYPADSDMPGFAYDEEDFDEEDERYNKANAEVEKFEGKTIIITDLYDGDVYGYLGSTRFMVSTPLDRGHGVGKVSDGEIQISSPDFGLSEEEEAFLRRWTRANLEEDSKPYATMKDGPDKYLFRKDNKQKLVGSADNKPENGEEELEETDMDKFIREMQIAAGIIEADETEENKDSGWCADCETAPCECSDEDKEWMREGELPDALKKHQFGAKDDNDSDDDDSDDDKDEVDEGVSEWMKRLAKLDGAVVKEDCGECSPFSHADENVDMVREDDTWPGAYEDSEKWLGQAVKITGGDYAGESGKVVHAESPRDETGGRQAEFMVKLHSGEVVTLYPGEWANDQLELGEDLLLAPQDKAGPEVDEDDMVYGEPGKGKSYGPDNFDKVRHPDDIVEPSGPELDHLRHPDDIVHEGPDSDDPSAIECPGCGDLAFVKTGKLDSGDDEFECENCGKYGTFASLDEGPGDGDFTKGYTDDSMIDVGDSEDYEDYSDFYNEFETMLGGSSDMPEAELVGMYEMNRLRELAGLEQVMEEECDKCETCDCDPCKCDKEELDEFAPVIAAVARGAGAALVKGAMGGDEVEEGQAADDQIAYEVDSETAYFLMTDILGNELDFGPEDEILVPTARNDQMLAALEQQGFVKGRDFWVAGEQYEADLQNGYNDRAFSDGQDYFPKGAQSQPSSDLGPSASGMADNPMSNKMRMVKKNDVYETMKLAYRRFRKA